MYHIFKTRMNHVWNVFALWAMSVSLRKELIWHLTHLLVFLHQKPDLWTASEEPPGTMSSLHNIWLVFQWSKPTRHYESNADEDMFSTVNQQAVGGESGLLGAQRGSEWLWEEILWFTDGEIQMESSYFFSCSGIGFKEINITCTDLSSLVCFKVIFQHRHWRKIK